MILDVVGSNPIIHPIFRGACSQAPRFLRRETAGIATRPVYKANDAKVAELVDAPDLGSGIFTM